MKTESSSINWVDIHLEDLMKEIPKLIDVYNNIIIRDCSGTFYTKPAGQIEYTNINIITCYSSKNYDDCANTDYHWLYERELESYIESLGVILRTNTGDIRNYIIASNEQNISEILEPKLIPFIEFNKFKYHNTVIIYDGNIKKKYRLSQCIFRDCIEFIRFIQQILERYKSDSKGE